MLLLALFLDPSLAAGPAYGATASPVSDIAACRVAATRAEQSEGLPPGLLLAIGRQESGRWDVSSGEVLPWPFATNAAGVSHFFQTRIEAVGYVALQQRSGLASIDVGCFQVNLRHHPGAFATLDEAFDPEANARYAAHFLMSLYNETGNWPAAIGRYHSATFSLAQSYRAAVLNQWKQPAGIRAIAVHRPESSVEGVIVQRPGGCSGSNQGPGLPRVITPTIDTIAACR